MTKDSKWIPSEALDEAKKQQALMAGYVDRSQSGLADEVKSADLARFVVAMTQFLDATEGVEKSQSKLVKERLTQIKEARAQVKLLAFMMGNFLVRKMQRPGGAVESVYSVKENKVVSKSMHLIDQLSVIHAFVELERVMQMSEFKARAIEVYYSLNQNFWNDEAGFYSDVLNSELKGEFRKPTPIRFVGVLRTLARLKSLPGQDFSRGQIQFLVDAFSGQVQ
jgi:hypothetical protein